MPRFFDPEGAFWSKVDRSGDPDSCWEWRRYREPNGYGKVSVWGKKILAHRYSYELFYGSVPVGLEVCHRCNNPGCVNPKHLYAGTRSQNMFDAVSAGTHYHGPGGDPPHLRGADHPSTHLAEDQVLEIYRRAWANEPYPVIARDYSISRHIVANIKLGRSWGWLTQPPPE